MATTTLIDRYRNWSAAMAGPTVIANQANAAPLEGDIGINAAALLVVLGVWALIMGARNLRDLRHKRMAPDNRQRPSQYSDEEPDPPEKDA